MFNATVVYILVDIMFQNPFAQLSIPTVCKRQSKQIVNQSRSQSNLERLINHWMSWKQKNLGTDQK